MLEEASSPLCYECHREFARDKPECIETARHFHESLTRLVSEVQPLEARVPDLAERGLDPDRLASTVESLRDTLREARSRIHSFDRGEFDRVLGRGEEWAVQGSALIEEAEAEYRFRLPGLGVAIGPMGLLGVLLTLKIREVARRGP
jgi:hypothetical protein